MSYAIALDLGATTAVVAIVAGFAAARRLARLLAAETGRRAHVRRLRSAEATAVAHYELGAYQRHLAALEDVL